MSRCQGTGGGSWRPANGACRDSPVQANGRLAGMVLLPPPPQRRIAGERRRILSLPGTLVLFAVTAMAALGNLRAGANRLRELERAAERFGAGELSSARRTRARRDRACRHRLQPHGGHLEQRTDALRISDQLRRQMLARYFARSCARRSPRCAGISTRWTCREIVLDEERQMPALCGYRSPQRFDSSASSPICSSSRASRTTSRHDSSRASSPLSACLPASHAASSTTRRPPMSVFAQRSMRRWIKSWPSESPRPGPQQPRRQRAASHATWRRDCS